MKNLIHKTIKNPLISGSAFIFAGTFFGNIFNFLFTLYMRKNMTLADYGILISLVSVISLFGFSATAIVPTVVRFAASYFANNELAMVRGLFIKITKSLFIIGAIILTIFILFHQQVGEFLKINEYLLIILLGINVFLGIIVVTNQAFLQAKLDFSFIAVVNFFGALFKFIFGVIFIVFGLKVVGGMLAFFMSGLIPYLLSFTHLRFIFHRKIQPARIGFLTLFEYGGPAALALLSLTSLVNTDIILVKHFFNPKEAGIYATLSLIGKIIFYFSAPIGTVMFPLIVQRHTKKENYNTIFWLSLLLVLLASVAICIFYSLFPAFTVNIFSNNGDALAAVPFVGIFGIFTTMYSLLTIVTNYYLSTQKTKVFIPLVLGALVQIILISLFHNDFLSVIYISLGITSLLLILLLLYYLMHYEKKDK